jgi:hypothetical protein
VLPRTSGSHSAATIAMLLRLPRLLRVVQLFHGMERWRFANLVSVLRLLVITFLACHWTACLWHGLYEWLGGGARGSALRRVPELLASSLAFGCLCKRGGLGTPRVSLRQARACALTVAR